MHHAIHFNANCNYNCNQIKGILQIKYISMHQPAVFQVITDLSVSCQVFLSLWIGLLCSADRMAYSEEKFFLVLQACFGNKPHTHVSHLSWLMTSSVSEFS